jgi:uncharacterized membrane protein
MLVQQIGIGNAAIAQPVVRSKARCAKVAASIKASISGIKVANAAIFTYNSAVV